MARATASMAKTVTDYLRKCQLTIAPRRRLSVVPLDRPGGEHVAAQRPAEHLAHRARRLEQPLQGDARSRSPSRAASRRGPRWRCCRSRPAAPGSRPARRSSTRSESTPASSAASTFARPWPRVLWKCAVSSTPGSALARAREELAHLARVGHAGRVAEADLLARPRRRSRAAMLEHPLGRHVALVGAAEDDRDHALAAQPRLARAAETRSQPGQRLRDRAVDVLAVVGLATPRGSR